MLGMNVSEWPIAYCFPDLISSSVIYAPTDGLPTVLTLVKSTALALVKSTVLALVKHPPPF